MYRDERPETTTPYATRLAQAVSTVEALTKDRWGTYMAVNRTIKYFPEVDPIALRMLIDHRKRERENKIQVGAR
jgi:ribosomal 50S subunit-associated protein YjgA (DUF615 family)